jgi:hypothetical protein
MQKGTIGTKQEQPSFSCYRMNCALLMSQVEEETPSFVAKLRGITIIKRT